MSDFGNVLLVALGIGLLIFVHEFGHYLAARWIGVRVEVFSLGFGPRLCGFRRGATDYRLSMIPLGGYVAVAGQDPTDRHYDKQQSLYGKTVGQRMLFYCGGVVMNLLFALVAFPIAFHSGVPFQAPKVGRVEPGTAAWEADLRPGDRITAVAGKPTYSFDNLFVEIALSGPGPVTLRVERGAESRLVEVWPQFRALEGLYSLGIFPAEKDEPPTLRVAKDSKGAAAGLRDGDLLLQVDGLITTGPAAERAFEKLDGRTDQSVTLRVRRDAEEMDITVAPQPDPTPPRAMIGVRPMPRAIAGIRPGCRLVADLGLQRGDVLLAINAQTYTGGDLAGNAPANGDLAIVVQRGSEQRTLTGRQVTPADLEQLARHIALRPEADGVVLQPEVGGAADLAGLERGDRLVAIDGQPAPDFESLREAVQAATQPLRMQVQRPAAQWPGQAQLVELTIQPTRTPSFDYGFVPQIPLENVIIRAEGVGDAIRLGCVCSLDLIKQLYVTIKRLVTGDVAAKNLGGIIQISRVSYQNVQSGLWRFLYFLALLSINLAFINVLPIPVLDGGHLLFLCIEKIKGSPVNTTVLTYSQIFGLVFVLALVVFVTYNDILRML